MADDFLRHPAFMRILSRRSNPALDAPQEVWDAAMAFFTPQERGYIANRAAHHWTIIEEEEGIISIVFFDENDPSRNCGELLYRYGPDVFHSCALDKTSLDVRIDHIKREDAK
jgi:hypothetical protein